MYPTEAMPSFLPNPSLVAAMFYEDAYVKRMIERKKNNLIKQVTFMAYLSVGRLKSTRDKSTRTIFKTLSVIVQVYVFLI